MAEPDSASTQSFGEETGRGTRDPRDSGPIEPSAVFTRAEAALLGPPPTGIEPGRAAARPARTDPRQERLDIRRRADALDAAERIRRNLAALMQAPLEADRARESAGPADGDRVPVPTSEAPGPAGPAGLRRVRRVRRATLWVLAVGVVAVATAVGVPRAADRHLAPPTPPRPDSAVRDRLPADPLPDTAQSPAPERLSTARASAVPRSPAVLPASGTSAGPTGSDAPIPGAGLSPSPGATPTPVPTHHVSPHPPSGSAAPSPSPSASDGTTGPRPSDSGADTGTASPSVGTSPGSGRPDPPDS